MTDDFDSEFIDDAAKGLAGKQPGEIADELKKQLLIKEYINEATEGMGGKQRNDVARELRSHILDSADAMAAERNVTVSEQVIKDVLRKMGPAKKIAAMYPAKKTVFEHGMGKALLSLAGIAVAFLLVAGILWIVSPDTLHMMLPGESAQDVLQVILSVVFALAIAIVVIACIFLCMYIYNTTIRTPYEDRLKALDRQLNDRTNAINVAVRIAGTLIWLVLLNVFWSRALFIQGFNDNATLIPVMSDKFAAFLPFFNALGIVTILLALSYLLIRQKWIPSLLDAVVNLANAMLFLWVLAAFPFNPELTAASATLIRFILAFIVFGCLVATAKQLWDTMKFALYGRIEKDDVV